MSLSRVHVSKCQFGLTIVIRTNVEITRDRKSIGGSCVSDTVYAGSPPRPQFRFGIEKEIDKSVYRDFTMADSVVHSA